MNPADLLRWPIVIPATIVYFVLRNTINPSEATKRVMDLYRHNADMQDLAHATAHLIHGSSEDRFKITYAPGHLTKTEIEGVNFGYADIQETIDRYRPKAPRFFSNDIVGRRLEQVEIGIGERTDGSGEWRPGVDLSDHAGDIVPLGKMLQEHLCRQPRPRLSKLISHNGVRSINVPLRRCAK